MTFKAIFLTGTLVTAGLVVDAGVIHVKVHEKKPDGTNLNLYVPAILATGGAHFVPDRHLERMAREMRDVLPALAVAARELEKIPDGPLVEVTSEREQVSVVKEGGNIVVDVNDRGETVHVSVPLRMIHSLARQLEEKTARLSSQDTYPKGD
jgi:hypothetical protein